MDQQAGARTGGRLENVVDRCLKNVDSFRSGGDAPNWVSRYVESRRGVNQGQFIAAGLPGQSHEAGEVAVCPALSVVPSRGRETGDWVDHARKDGRAADLLSGFLPSAPGDTAGGDSVLTAHGTQAHVEPMKARANRGRASRRRNQHETR